MPCGNLGNTKTQKYARSKFFGVTQRSLSSPIYTSLKDVRRAFALIKEENIFT